MRGQLFFQKKRFFLGRNPTLKAMKHRIITTLKQHMADLYCCHINNEAKSVKKN
jgi:hypothetical protein